MTAARPDPDKVFPSREAAEDACRRLNREPPEYGYWPWHFGGPVGETGEWWVVRYRGIMEEDLRISAQEYEQRYRAVVAESASRKDHWVKLEGIDIEAVRLQQQYPHTELAVVFRPVRDERRRERQFHCRFGYRDAIWPAQETDPAHEAGFWEIYFMEFVGTDPRARPIWEGPCDPEAINWLN